LAWFWQVCSQVSATHGILEKRNAVLAPRRQQSLFAFLFFSSFGYNLWSGLHPDSLLILLCSTSRIKHHHHHHDRSIWFPTYPPTSTLLQKLLYLIFVPSMFVYPLFYFQVISVSSFRYVLTICTSLSCSSSLVTYHSYIIYFIHDTLSYIVFTKTKII
jgi:hypothetical protein